MKLNLKNPIVFFDLETTGINIAADRIVEIAWLKVDLNGNETSKTQRVNPEMPIPEKVTAIHGISNEDVKDAPTFNEIARTLAKEIEGCDLAGYNSIRFDIPLLAEELLRSDVDFEMKGRVTVDVKTIYHKMEQRTLSAAYKFYCDKNLDGAHGAEADTNATFEVLKQQIQKYDVLENDMKFLSEFSSRRKFADFAGFIVFNKKNNGAISVSF